MVIQTKGGIRGVKEGMGGVILTSQLIEKAALRWKEGVPLGAVYLNCDWGWIHYIISILFGTRSGGRHTDILKAKYF